MCYQLGFYVQNSWGHIHVGLSLYILTLGEKTLYSQIYYQYERATEELASLCLSASTGQQETAGPCCRQNRGQSLAFGLPAMALPDSARTLVFAALHPLRPWLRWLPKLILYFIYLMSWLLSLNTITILYSCYYTHDIYYIIHISINPNNNFILCKLGTPGVDTKITITKITILVLKVLRTMITCMGGFPTPDGCPTNLIQFWP